MDQISNISFKGRRVLIRVDFNVPLDKNHNITDDSRIVASLPTINSVLCKGGCAIIISHLGRPKNGYEDRYSLKHLVSHLSILLKKQVDFCSSCINDEALAKSKNMKAGEVLLLENVRFHTEEKKGDPIFAKKLSALADFYINDAFGSAHRNHASTSVVANYFHNKKCFGHLMSLEVRSLKLALERPKRPFTAIIGGAKISGKIDVIKSLFKQVDYLIIGGGMAYTFIRALGGKTGSSLCDEEKIGLAKELVEMSKEYNVSLILPTDSINASEFKNDAITNNSDIFCIPSDFMGLDIGPDSVNKFTEIISVSKTIIWNGPMGVFELSNFQEGTKKIARSIALATKKGAYSLVGGGDSVAAVKRFNLYDCFSYISTGGGAMLEYLEGKELPGVSSIEG